AVRAVTPWSADGPVTASKASNRFAVAHQVKAMGAGRSSGCEPCARRSPWRVTQRPGDDDPALAALLVAEVHRDDASLAGADRGRSALVQTGSSSPSLPSGSALACASPHLLIPVCRRPHGATTRTSPVRALERVR